MSENGESAVAALGEEPLYTPFPNPFLASFVEQLGNGEDPIVGQLDASVSAGKNTYVYDTHTYHTKVPPAGIEVFLKAFTRPNDLVLDPFCGSGMTGVAALSVGRHAILADLSPAATFIAYNFLRSMPVEEWDAVCQAFLKPFARLEKALYHTTCRECGRDHKLEYTVWSYRVRCPDCGEEFNYWDVGQSIGDSVRTSRLRREVNCPKCDHVLPKRRLQRKSLEPVLLGYHCPLGRGRQETMVPPQPRDLELLTRIREKGIPSRLWYPKVRLPNGYNTRQPIPYGISTIDAFYTTRNLWAMAALWRRASRWPNAVQRQRLLFALTGLYLRVTKFSEFRFWGGSGNAPRLYVPMVMNEQNVFDTLRRKFRHIRDHLSTSNYDAQSKFCITTQSSTALTGLPDKSIDYIFTDPPFGGNINYSEMNFLWESWLGRYTEIQDEAIINPFQSKGGEEYEELLAKVFGECRRVLKPKGCMTVVFNNSSQDVWRRLASAIRRGGFAIDASYTFDKRHPTLKQLTAANVAGLDVALVCRAASEYSELPTASETQLANAVDKYLASEGATGAGKRTARSIYGAANASLLHDHLVPPMNFEAFRGWLVEHFSSRVEPEPVPRYLREIARRREALPTKQLSLL